MANSMYGPTVSSSLQQGVKRRTTLGVGIITLLTILVIMLLAAFSVLSLAAVRSDMHLTEMATQAASDYYAADSKAIEWYAELDTFLATEASSNWAISLANEGYTIVDSSNSEVFVRETFAVDEHRVLTVTISVASDGFPTVRQWQSVSVVTE